MRLGLLAVGEEPGAFQRHIDAELAPGQLRRVALRGHGHPAAAGIHGAVLGLDLAGVGAVDGIVAQQMGVGFHRTQIVEGDDLDIVAPAFQDGAQHQAADAPESVDRDTNWHIP